MKNSIRICTVKDMPVMYTIINTAAAAYEGKIPVDCYHQPYMSGEELQREMHRITFLGWQSKDQLVGIMGLERSKDVTLIRHAYVLPEWQGQGIGSRLLEIIVKQTQTTRLLVGTWADATWAVDFYQKHGFRLHPDKHNLLKNYWNISPRQIETSVVLEKTISL